MLTRFLDRMAVRELLQLYTKCGQLNFALFLLTLLHHVPVISWVFAVGQGSDNVHNGKIPLLLVPGAPYPFRAKNDDFTLRINRQFFAHGFAPFSRLARRAMLILLAKSSNIFWNQYDGQTSLKNDNSRFSKKILLGNWILYNHHACFEYDGDRLFRHPHHNKRERQRRPISVPRA